MLVRFREGRVFLFRQSLLDNMRVHGATRTLDSCHSVFIEVTQHAAVIFFLSFFALLLAGFKNTVKLLYTRLVVLAVGGLISLALTPALSSELKYLGKVTRVIRVIRFVIALKITNEARLKQRVFLERAIIMGGLGPVVLMLCNESTHGLVKEILLVLR